MDTITPIQPNFSQPLPPDTVPTPPPTPIQTQPLPPPPVETPKPKSKWKKILLIIGIIFLIGVAGLGYLLFQGVKDAPQVSAQVSSFMQFVSTGDFSDAYSLTSSQFKNSLSQQDFNSAMISFKAQYSGFQSQKQTGFSVEANAGQPTLYKYTGAITYDNGDEGMVTANLVKEDGGWKILYIKVNIDVKRLQEFQQQDQSSVLGVSTSN
jgi:flagellar basal body-associated protein FliL